MSGLDSGAINGNVWWKETSPNFYANGVNGFTVSGYTTYRWSAYFDTLVMDMYNYMLTIQ